MTARVSRATMMTMIDLADLSPAARRRAQAADRTRRVLELSRRGMTRRAIAAATGIPHSTVRDIEQAAGIARERGRHPKGDHKFQRLIVYVAPATAAAIERAVSSDEARTVSDWCRGALERAVERLQ